MDYSDVLSSINNKLSSIISLLEDIKNGSVGEFLILLFGVFLILWILRGE